MNLEFISLANNKIIGLVSFFFREVHSALNNIGKSL